MFHAIKIVLDNNKELMKENKFRVICHTDARYRDCCDLKLLAKRTGIGKYVIFKDLYMAIQARA